jgi:hypothetical protein
MWKVAGHLGFMPIGDDADHTLASLPLTPRWACGDMRHLQNGPHAVN